MQNFINYHLKKYSQITTQDVVKMLYQNHFGPGHFIKNIDYAISYYKLELLNSKINIKDNLYEHIGNDYIRVNIHQYNLLFKDNELINMFYNSALIKYNKEEQIKKYKEIISSIPSDYFIKNYNFTDVHHSLIYNALYHPHYRVIHTKFLTLDMKIAQLQYYLDNLVGFNIVAMEGRCGSGKTTIANKLKDVTIIDVDEFFLKKELKTKERLEEIGGNIDYDLYLDCVKQLNPNTTITYKIFDCSTQSYKEKTIYVSNKVLLVGVYSYHEKIREYINKLVYLYVNKEDQLERIKKRELYEKFINEWIPLEERYYNSFDFISNCDLIV